MLPPAPTAAADTVVRHTEKTTQLGFAYTTPCLVTGGGIIPRCVNDNNIVMILTNMSMIIFCPVPCESGYMYDCNSGECQQCPHGSYQPQWGQTRSGEPVTRVQLYTCHVLLPLH